MGIQMDSATVQRGVAWKPVAVDCGPFVDLGVTVGSMVRMRWLTVLGLALLAGTAWGWRGEVLRVYDGNVVSVRYGRGPANVQLYGIIVPKRGEPLSNAARELTKSLVKGARTVRVLPAEDPRPGIVGWVFVKRTCLNHALVKAGLARWDQARAPNDKALARLEDEARRARRGIWAHSK